MDKIIGMGNALVDVLVTLQDDSLLDEMSLPKGSMQLINEDKFLKISGKYSGMQTHKATGGSAGNTVLALANLGAHPGFIGKIGNDDFGQYFKKNGLKQGIDMKLLAGDLPTGVAIRFFLPLWKNTKSPSRKFLLLTLWQSWVRWSSELRFNFLWYTFLYKCEVSPEQSTPRLLLPPPR